MAFDYKRSPLDAYDQISGEASINRLDLGLVFSQASPPKPHEYGDGIKKNVSLAVKWYTKAADQGYTDAQKALAELGSS